METEVGNPIDTALVEAQSSKKDFSIYAQTCTLKFNDQKNGGTILGKKIKYIIPIYQRPYSWTDKEIKKFIKDIFTSFWGNSGDAKEEPMFIGTMQLSSLKDGNKQEVIDGQQRLTTILLFLKVLKNKHPYCQELLDIQLDWLETKVNSGKQQVYLQDALNNIETTREGDLNQYYQNLNLIQEILEEILDNDNMDFVEFDISKFARFFLSSVYFVTIETYAGLSKTLQIFNAINTTGLDLNGGDIFKIRMYEYLHDIKGRPESVFEEISAVYEKIDSLNKECGNHVVGITRILSIYQNILIAKYNLPVVLYNYGTDTFFERLFDTIFKLNQWEHFNHNVSQVELSLNDILDIIDCRFTWERKWRQKSDMTTEDACAIRLIWGSRYGKYWDLIFVFLFQNKEDEAAWEKMLLFTRLLNRLFFIYSVRFQRIKSEIYYTFMHKLISALVNSNFEQVMSLLAEGIGDEKKHNQDYYNLNYFLTENLPDNAKRKNLVCRLSAVLDEDYQSQDPVIIKEVVKKVFDTDVDIEHIQSFHDKELEKRNEIWELWGNDINSLGNLMLLEQNINRKIQNRPYHEKIKDYKKSKLTCANSFCDTYGIWDLESCRIRKENELKKILSYLFQG